MRFILVLTATLLATLAVFALMSTENGPGAAPATVSANSALGLAAGDYHSCALTESGGVKCWGWNPYGQLGDGRSCGFFCPFAVDVSGITSGATSIAAGGYHTCAALIEGDAKCWGANQNGQLGDGSTVQGLAPVSVSGLHKPVTKLTAGYNHSCARLESGTVECWGSGEFGQLGSDGNSGSATPVTVSGLVAIDVGAGGFSSCAVTASGGVRCWGYNSLGQLGDGTTQNRNVPVEVLGISDATAVSVGESHACALRSAGGVRCWGSNAEGQLGDGTHTERLTPVSVSGLTDVAAISAGGYFTCALLNSGGVKCWGDNSFSQLGDARACGRLCATPIGVTDVTAPTTIASGLRHACAAEGDGSVTCWGANDTGQLATGDRDPSAAPPPQPPVNIDLKAPVPPTPTRPPTSSPTSPPLTPVPTATPFGGCGEIPNSITTGPHIGMTTDHSVNVVVRSCRPATITLEYKTAGSEWSAANVVGPVATNSAADHTAILPLDGLAASTAYDYRVLVNGQTPLQLLEGHFRTLPPEGQEATFSFLIGTDMHLTQFPMPTIVNSVLQHEPLFGVVGGDNVLTETFQVPPPSQNGYYDRYTLSLAEPGVREFLSNVPFAALWSDHEIYNDWDHRTSPPYPYARAAFDAYFGEVNPPPRNPAGIQYSFKAADTEFYVIDVRTFRSPDEFPDGPTKAMLGAEQKQDLKNWLQTSNARFKFIVSDVWWNDYSGHAFFGESWPAYSTERNEIFDFIQTNRIPGVVLISGDEHLTGVFRLEPWGVYEIAPGPMSWAPSPPLAPDPQILYSAGHTRVFGIFEIDTTACPATLDVTLYGETNNVLFNLPLTERDLGADADGNGLVPCEEGNVNTATPTPTRSPTPTRTPTPAGGIAGDANCDDTVNSIDAAIILQRVAGLLANIPCATNADVNNDGQINAIDASLVLQYAAGLLNDFP